MGKKRGKLILVLTVLAAVAVAAVSRIYWTSTLPEHEPGSAQLKEHADETQKEQRETKEITIGEDTLVASLQEALDHQITVSDLSVEIDGSEGTALHVTGTVSKEEMAALLEKQSDSISKSYQAILSIFPKELPLDCKIQLAASGNGTVEIIPQSLTISSMEIADSMLPDGFYDTVESGLNHELQKQFSSVDEISVQDGTLVIRGT
ncbi:MAG: hypothetical protein Q4D42_06940 [Eubacteriales bacterium]|nr:hypothetical protein [Eubacteriales bacterium]